MAFEGQNWSPINWKKKDIFYKEYIVCCRMIRNMLQAVCFFGNVLSLVIVTCIIRLGSPPKLTFLNKLFLLYYVTDAIVGSTEVNFLFQLNEER